MEPVGGSLAVARDGKIIVEGTKEEPVIMTSTADLATWTNRDPETGKWRETAGEWGNLTIMGRAYISENAKSGNVPTFSANNIADMEGHIRTGNPSVIHYGGGDDNHNSGKIEYLSIRYGGRVLGLGNELNGLSLGGVGRATEIHHVEVMNNLDDGIEIWGGTVNLKYFSVWNVGDDSLDIDQGYRGQIQFGLIVQGHCKNAPQGSGVGDNAIEMDGAEDSDWQPRTRAVIYNTTIIGQPYDGDGLTAWRDGAGVQFRNCIFMDGGEQVVRPDGFDGDGGSGYGFGSSLKWKELWTAPATSFPAGNAPPSPSAFYTAQVSNGRMAEISDSVFFRNQHPEAYTEAENRGVFSPQNNNIREPLTQPIVSISRGTPVFVGRKWIYPVVALDAQPAGVATTSSGMAPSNGFFTPAKYRGAFAPGENWIPKRFASRAFRFPGGSSNGPWFDLGNALSGTNGLPTLTGTGGRNAGDRIDLVHTNGVAGTVYHFLGTSNVSTPIYGGTLVPGTGLVIPGAASLKFARPRGIPCILAQALQLDRGAVEGVAFSNAVLCAGDRW